MLIHPPEKKRDVFVAHITNEKGRVVRVNLQDTKIFHVQPLKNDAWTLQIYIPHDTQAHATVTELDERAIVAVIANNEEWFENKLSQQHIHDYFRPCIDRECVSVIVSSSKVPRSVSYNGMSLNAFEELLVRDITKLQCECTFEASGLYFYPKKFGIKWVLRDIDVYDKPTCDEPECNDKKEIEEFWKQELHDFNSTIDEDIKSLGDKVATLQSLKKELRDILEEATSQRECNTAWNEHLNVLKNRILKYKSGRL
jgi:hypothetical protein